MHHRCEGKKHPRRGCDLGIGQDARDAVLETNSPVGSRLPVAALHKLELRSADELESPSPSRRAKEADGRRGFSAPRSDILDQ